MKAAKDGRLVTHAQVMRALGYGPNVFADEIGPELELVLIACVRNGLPKLLAIIINYTPPHLSEEYSVVDKMDACEEVMLYRNWPKALAIDWEEVFSIRMKMQDPDGLLNITLPGEQ